MNSYQALDLFVNPFLMWSRLAWKTGEMALAASPVVWHRAQRMALAGEVPGPRDQREFALMGQEKMEAGLEAAQDVATRMVILNQQFAALAFKHALWASSALLSLAASRTVAQARERQSRLVEGTATRTAAAASTLSGSSAQLARRALAPAHARIRRNARRLRKR